MKTAMLELPAVLVYAINDFDFADKPLWRIGEGLHHVKVELTFLLPTDQPTADKVQKGKPRMSKGTENMTKTPTPLAGEWPRQLLAAERPHTSLPALHQTTPPPTLTTTTPPPTTIEFKRRPTTSTPVIMPPKKMPSLPDLPVPTTKQSAPKKKQPKKKTPPSTVEPTRKLPTPLTTSMETNQPSPPPPQKQPSPAPPAPRKPWTGDYHTWQLETGKNYQTTNQSNYDTSYAYAGLMLYARGSDNLDDRQIDR